MGEGERGGAERAIAGGEGRAGSMRGCQGAAARDIGRVGGGDYSGAVRAW